MHLYSWDSSSSPIVSLKKMERKKTEVSGAGIN
jgi:hypothetical protein